MDEGTQLVVLLFGLVISLVYLFAQIRLFAIDKKLGQMLELQKAHAIAAGVLISGWKCGNCGKQAEGSEQPATKCSCGYQDWRQVAIAKSAIAGQ